MSAYRALCLLAMLLVLGASGTHYAEAWNRAGQSAPNRKPVYPTHPRVNINWTQGSINSELTRLERQALEENKFVLTKLIVINRHGHRAPNALYWSMCFGDRGNRKYYNVDAEDLSAQGMQEEYYFGQYIHQTYRDFLGDRFNRSHHFFRAVGEPRILQSAMAVAQGIFPDGFGPGGFLPSRPQFVPIFSDMDTHEYLLDEVPCFRRAEVDSERWLNNSFKAFVAKHAATLDKMHEVCGNYTSGPNDNYKYIKTVTDGMTFNSDFGLKVAKGRLTPEWLYKIRAMSFQLLMDRLYNTDEQQTYTSVNLPFTVLALLNHTRLATGEAQFDFTDTRQEASFYFVHREALYAFAQFFGFQFAVPGLPKGEIPVASALIIEKLMPRNDQFSHDESEVYVRFTMRTPYNGMQTISIPACRIPELCELSEVRTIFLERNKRTGTWEELCNYVPFELDHTNDIR